MKAVRRSVRSKPSTRTRTRAFSRTPRSASKKQSAPDAQPVSLEEFSTALESPARQAPIAVAVSGGADSMAALVLTKRWCAARDLAPPIAVTVDHGLRKEAAAEARQVAAWSRRLGVEHVTLTWEGDKPASNIQAVAREARYRLIGEWARCAEVKTIVTGHSLNDQAETFLMRLARGSGLDGLCAMAPVSQFPARGYDWLTLGRPLLKFSRARLEATLKAAKQPWLEDPSNDALRFQRVQVRQARDALEAAGLTAERIASAARHLRRVRKTIDRQVDELLYRRGEVSNWGYVLIPIAELSYNEEVGLRALARAISAVGGEDYPPRFEGLDAVSSWATSGQGPRGRTLGGCRLVRRTDGMLLVAREDAAVPRDRVPLQPAEPVIWDGRFRVIVERLPGLPLAVGPLDSKGLALVGPHAKLPPVEPRLIARTTPALWTAQRLMAAPLLSYYAKEMSGVPHLATFLGLGQR